MCRRLCVGPCGNSVGVGNYVYCWCCSATSAQERQQTIYSTVCPQTVILSTRRVSQFVETQQIFCCPDFLRVSLSLDKIWIKSGCISSMFIRLVLRNRNKNVFGSTEPLHWPQTVHMWLWPGAASTKCLTTVLLIAYLSVSALKTLLSARLWLSANGGRQLLLTSGVDEVKGFRPDSDSSQITLHCRFMQSSCKHATTRVQGNRVTWPRRIPEA